MTLQDALLADRAGDFLLAATRYEELLATQDAAPELLVNLAVLYWLAIDPGQAASLRLTAEYMAHAWRRTEELLTEAGRRFPRCTEARFWKRYIEWADLGAPFSLEECRQLLQEDPAVLVPAMQVFNLSDGIEAEPEARELLRRCREEGTARARYVASAIEVVFARAKRR